ncbi:MAG: M23 family metallopeptidase [bacterium]|nr:M23 family metallopeptidase [bacterium]
MLFNFFGAKITVSTIDDNAEYADEYKSALNNNIKDGYVSLARILYFYLENDTLSFDEIYKLNVNPDTKKMRDIESVCKEDKLKNMTACEESSINENKDFINSTNQYFNFPLNNSYTITSFFNEERIIYGESNRHSGWDFALPAQTKVYSVCKGKIYKKVETQEENIPYDESGNRTGNSLTIECSDDYAEKYYVLYAHLYPHSIKLNVGDEVGHYTEVAEVGTTGYSTGNHLHFQVYDKDWNLIDGMELVDLLVEYDENYNPTGA